MFESLLAGACACGRFKDGSPEVCLVAAKSFKSGRAAAGDEGSSKEGSSEPRPHRSTACTTHSSATTTSYTATQPGRLFS